jgi:hypothetical protein
MWVLVPMSGVVTYLLVFWPVCLLSWRDAGTVPGTLVSIGTSDAGAELAPFWYMWVVAGCVMCCLICSFVGRWVVGLISFLCGATRLV